MSSNNAARGRRLELSSDEDSSSSSSSSSAVVTVRTRPGVTPADQPPHPTTGATAPTARRSGRPHTPNRRLFDHEPAEEGGRRREHHRHEESASQRQRSASPRHRSASPPPPPLRRSGAEANVDDPMSGDGSEEGSADELLNYAANEISRRPAARSRTRWTQQMDVELLETVAEVGTGNWPRVLIVGHSYHKLTHVTGFSTLRRRYTQLRSAKSWLEKPPKVPPLKVPRNTPARQAAAIEQEHADAAAEAHKQWEYCVRLCMKIDARQESLGTGKKANQPTDEQALLQRARKKESVRNTAKDARNAHFQELVDKDAEIRSSLATSIEARTASGDRIGRAMEMMALALLSKTLGADAARELFPPPAPPTLAAPPARGDN